MSHDQPEGVDESGAGSEDNTTNDNSETTGLNANISRLVILFGSLWIGALLGLWFLIQGNLLLAGIFFLTASGIPILIAMIDGGESRTKSPRKNKPTSSTKQCPDCGWHNHQANNNCVECGETFVGQSDHREANQSKQICSNCGWQNPHGNSYCIDCGKVINE
jgi:predicted RNA-binding Zn-ribbon protein involved in translation (DUF1610 family)